MINLNKIKTPALQKGMEFYLMGEPPPLLRLGWLRALLLRNTGPCFYSTAGCGLRAGGDQLYDAARSVMESATKKK